MTDHAARRPQLRPLGRSGLQVAELGFGAATLGGVYGEIDESEVMRAVHHAIDVGVTLFDVAPYYGITVAEERLGRALEGRRDEVVLMSKCGRYDVADFDFSRARLLASIDESLGRLRTDRLDVLFAHDVEFGDFTQIVEETIPALREIQASGKARAIGISGLPVTHLRKIAEAAPVDVILSYCRANLLDDGAIRTLADFCRETGTGLVNASPLHMGILRGSEPPEWHPAPREIQELGMRLSAMCKEKGSSLPRLALRYALDLAREHMDATLCGMKTVAEVDGNLGSLLDEADEAERALLHELRAEVGDAFNWTWLQGRPENSRGAGEARHHPS